MFSYIVWEIGYLVTPTNSELFSNINFDFHFNQGGLEIFHLFFFSLQQIFFLGYK